MRIATGGAVPPIDHFGLVDREASGVGGLEARGMSDGAVDVDHAAAGAADEVVVVVADPVLIAGGRAGGLDPSQEARLDEGPEAVEDRLMRDRPEGGPDAGLDLFGGGVRARGDRFEDRHPLGGDLQAVGPEAVGRGGKVGRVVGHGSGLYARFWTGSRIEWWVDRREDTHRPELGTRTDPESGSGTNLELRTGTDLELETRTHRPV